MEPNVGTAHIAAKKGLVALGGHSILALIVDDSASDAELMAAELRRRGFAGDIRHLASRADVEAAATLKPDIILLDYHVPGLTGEDGLRLVRGQWPDIPVIFVTGTIGEDRAVELVRRGATDYVLKDRLGRLTMVVDRALREQAQAREHARLEARLRDHERLEMLGRLAGGVAHDFANIVASADGFAQLAVAELPAQSEAADLLVGIRESLSRAKALTSQLLSFARGTPKAPELLDPHDVVVEMLPMLRQLLPANVTLTASWDSGPSHVLADRSQLEQVIVNLVVNARDAMPDGGPIEITGGTADIDDGSAFEVPVDAGCFVRIAVSDEGCGISDHVRAHMFEPCFSTKAPGKGTGLGLTTVHRIVASSQGGIAVQSGSGTGSTFVIYWPLAPRTPRLARRRARGESDAAARPTD